MNLEITYCVAWNYLPRAASLAAEIKKSKGLDTKLIKGMSGQFEVVLDGKLIYSKKATGRFPESKEVLDQIPMAS